MALLIESALAPAGALSGPIARCRYRGDVQGLEALAQAGTWKPGVRSPEAARQQATIRARLLAEGVRADAALMPSVALAVRELQERAGISESVEVYVFNEGCVNAFVTRGRSGALVGLSSGLVNLLTPREMEFAIGHELGHLAFGHVDVDTPHLHRNPEQRSRAGMALRAWQRAAEISADRAGLACCGSLAIATSAFFKTMTGVQVPEGSVDPAAFAAQWHDLEAEILASGSDEDWNVSHPHPPLRIRAMMLYWESLAATFTPGRPVDTTPSPDVDAAVERLLAMIDPLARESARAADPVLVDFLLWGGLALALADGHLSEAERACLASFLPPQRVQEAAACARSLEDCMERFRGVIAGRHGKLKAMEVHRIMEGLLQVLHADGGATPAGNEAFARIGNMLGVRERACELLLARFKSGG